MSTHTPAAACGMFDVTAGRMAEHEDHYDPEMWPIPLDDHAWPGGYPILYVSEDGGTFCGRHAWSVIVREDVPMMRDILWEGPAEWCDEGSHEIESAYGETEEDAS